MKIKVEDMNDSPAAIIEEIAAKSKIPIPILIRYVISKYSTINSIKRFQRLKNGIIGLSSQSVRELITIREYINGGRMQDPRKVLLELQKKRMLSDKKSLLLQILIAEYVKNQKVFLKEIGERYANGVVSDWLHNRAKIPQKILTKTRERYRFLLNDINRKVESGENFVNKQVDSCAKYPWIVGFHYRFNPFEQRILKIIERIGSDTVNNVLVTDASFCYITEIDILSKIGNKTIFFLCKDTNYRNFINKKWDILKKIENINSLLKPEMLVIVTSCAVSNRELFYAENVRVLDKRDLVVLEKSPEKMASYLRKKKKIYYNHRIRSGKDLRQVLHDKKISVCQLSMLLGMDNGYLAKVIREDKELTKNVLNRLQKLQSGRENNRILHLRANMSIKLKRNIFLLKYIRERLGVRLEGLGKIIGERPENIGNVERGLVQRGAVVRKIKNYLQKFSGFGAYKREALAVYRKQWTNIKSNKFKHLISIRMKYRENDMLEEEMQRQLEQNGFTTLKNAVISDKDASFRKEVDIYAIKNNKEMVIECSKTRIATKVQDIAALFSQYKRIGIKEVVYINPKLTPKTQQMFQAHKIVAMKPKEFGGYLNGNSYWP